MNLRTRVIAAIGATALLASTVLGAAAQSTSNEPVSVEVNGLENGTVSVLIEETRAFSDAEYSLTAADTSNGQLTVTATDTRGTARGWNVTLKATDFMRSKTTVGADIAISNLGLDAGTADRSSGVGTIPTSATDIGQVSTSAQQLWNAAVNQGDGIFTLPLEGTLNIPAGTLVDTYTSTVTAEIVAAP
jgi:hypothetical protein